jgi:hypothetical protein
MESVGVSMDVGVLSIEGLIARAMPRQKSNGYQGFSATARLAQTNWVEPCTICASGGRVRSIRTVQNRASCRLNAHARLVILRML